MRQLGLEIFGAVRKGRELTLPVKVQRTGTAVMENPNARFLKLRELGYTAENPFTGTRVSETWMSVMEGCGVIVFPIVEYKVGEKGLVLIMKPQPSVGMWSLELPSGGVRNGETIEIAGKRELLEETGLNASEIRIMPEMKIVWHAPHRIGTIDGVVIAEKMMFIGRQSTEIEELPIAPFILSWQEVGVLLRGNAIKQNASIAAIHSYLTCHASHATLNQVRIGLRTD